MSNRTKMMVLTVWLWTAVATGAAAAAGDRSPTVDDSIVEKLRGDLPEVLARAGDGEFVPVTIIMAEQTPRDEIEAAKQILDMGARRRAVIALLRETASATQADLLAMLRDRQAAGSVGERIHALWIHNLIATEVTAEVAYEIAARDDVAYLNYDRPVGIEVMPFEPAEPPASTGGIECGVDLMQAPRVWDELGNTGEGVIVGVIDTGVCITHPDLADHIWDNPGEIPGNNIDDDDNGLIDDIHGWNFRDDDDNIMDDGPGAGHGTHVAGTVAGDGTNGTQTGMAPDATIMVLKIWNNFSGESTLWRATEYGAEMGAQVLNVSYGWPVSRNPDKATWRATYENALAAGVVSVIAAGNQGECCPPVDHVTTPGNVPDIITAGATDCNDAIAGFSSRGPVTWQDVDPYNDWPYPPGKVKPSLSAPGVNTVSLAVNCTGYVAFSGTSMATPHLAGAAALMLAANPGLTPEQVKQVLMDTSIDLGEDGMDNVYGAGRGNAFEAVIAAESLRSIRFQYPDGRPDLIDPNGGTVMRVEVRGSENAQPEPGTGMFHYFQDDQWIEVPMVQVEDNIYDAVFPAVPCMDDLMYYLSADTTDGDTVTDPFNAPDRTYSATGLIGFADFFADDFETDQGWSVVNENVDGGAWERGVPFGSGDPAPDEDFDGSGQCYVTGNSIFNDVDGGPTRLISPRLDLQDRITTISFAQYFVSGETDRMQVEVSNDDGGSWTLVSDNAPNPDGWIEASFVIDDFVTPTADVRVRFSVADNPNNSFCEAAVDAFLIVETLCGEGGGCMREPAWQCDGDVDGDGQVNPVDSGIVQAAFGSGDDQDLCNYDLDCDGQINPVDAGIVQSLFGVCESPREACP